MLHLLIDAHVLISHDQEHQVSLPVESVQACTEENIVIPLESHWMIKLWTFDCISFHNHMCGPGNFAATSLQEIELRPEAETA